MPLKTHHPFPAMAAFAAVVLALITAFVGATLYQSRLHYVDEADDTARNLALALRNSLTAHFQEVDLALKRADAEFKAMHAARRFSHGEFSAYLRTLKERMPQARAVRGSDADGMVIYGEDVDLSRPQDLKIREFFARAKAAEGMVFGVPVNSRISGELVFPLVHALRYADGSFGGTAYVNTTNARISELIASLQLGQHGAITLIDGDKRLVHRHPVLPGVVPGSMVPMSAATAALIEGHSPGASYGSVSRIDGEVRRSRIEPIAHYPIYILVGLAERDFLAPWYRERRNSVVFLLLLYLITGSLLAVARGSLQRQRTAVAALVAKEETLQASLAALQASERRFRSFAEGVPQMIWTTANGRSFDYLSQHWTDYTGQDGAQLRQSDAFLSVLHPDDRVAMRAAWDAALAQGTAFRCECRWRRHDGAWRVFDNHALPQLDSAGAVAGWVGSSTDVTEQRAAHAALLAAKEQAQAAGQAKSAFLANMSHEIRSPMNAVLGMLQLLQRLPMAAAQRDYAAKAETAARSLLGILNDILDFSKVEEGKLTLDPHPFRIDQMLHDLATILSANANADGKDIEVLFDIDPALPQSVVGDRLRLQQVLLNLAGNAIKFTSAGEVVLAIAPVPDQGEQLVVAFSVRDTGIGIAPEHLEHIFDGFTQAEASTARRFGGTGLGLAISARLVALMGGSLNVSSVPGQGSVFSFSLVLRRGAPDAHEAQEAERRLGHQMQFLQCLVVDDNPTGRQVLAAMLASFGWRVDALASGAEALAAAARKSYDAVFMDWRMPELDGWDASVRLRAAAALEGRPAPLIVMVTAHDRELLASTGGALAPVLDAMLAKPLTASTLFDTVSALRLGGGGAPAALAAPAAAIDAPAQLLAGLRILVVDDNALNQQVARELLGGSGGAFSVVDSGRAAVAAVCNPANSFDVVLMDIQMPDMDGYAATALILAQLGPRCPPIVAMTANAMASDRQSALAAGMADHVGKPFDLEQLINVIVRHARARAPDAPATLDSAAALARMGGNAAIYQMALRSFDGEWRILAGQLGGAMEGEHAALALAALHVIRGLAAMIGAGALAGLAAQAEAQLQGEAPGPARWRGTLLVLAEGERAAEAARAQA